MHGLWSWDRVVRRGVAAVGAAALFLSPVRASAQPSLELVAMDFAFRAPSTAAAGLTTIRLRNIGAKLHHVQLFRLEEGKRLADLFRALSSAGSLHAAPPWAVPAGGPSAALPGTTIAVRQDLAPGTYAVICWIPAPDGQPHFLKGMMAELEVQGPAERAVEPPADVRVALRDYRAVFGRVPGAGRQTLRVENEGPQAHEFLLVRLKPGATPEDVEHWSGAGQVGETPVESWVGIAALAPRQVAWLDVDLPPGRYAVFCLAPDRSDGRPHFQHGFRQRFEVR